MWESGWLIALLAINSRYEKEFDNVQDVFELQRNLNNAFAYDLVPSTSVIIAALRAARRVNDFPTAVRIFEGTSSIPVNDVSAKTAAVMAPSFFGGLQYPHDNFARRILAGI